jgi:site-specific recombinase XerC
MTAKLQVLPDPQINPWPVLWESFERSLRADGASVQTLRMYREAGGQVHAYFAARGLPTDPQQIEKRHVEAWMVYLREERMVKPATLSARFSAVRRFFTWLEAEGEIALSPMVRMKAPKVEVVAPNVLTDDEQRRLLVLHRRRSRNQIRNQIRRRSQIRRIRQIRRAVGVNTEPMQNPNQTNQKPVNQKTTSLFRE